MSRPPSEADLPNPMFWVDIADNVGLTPGQRGAIVAAFADESMGGMFHWHLYEDENGYGRAWGAAFRRFAFARPYDGGVRFELYCRVRF